MSAAAMVPVACLTWFLAEPAARVFTNDAVVVAATASYLRIVALCFPALAVEAVYDGALTGAQHTLPTFLVGLLFNSMRIPLARLLVPRYGVAGVWAAISLSTMLKAPAKYLCFRSLFEKGALGEKRA
mmetsp:Transcript_26403/g.88789  ORF Transcript_26403/g.88789 Transcript_26403/m.88789 type:complete len:128 (+) Transcript_26403:1531-1914(+)